MDCKSALSYSLDEVYAHKLANKDGRVTLDTAYYRSFLTNLKNK